MLHCADCGNMLTSLTIGGCGGRGSLSGCSKCGAVFAQNSGGMLSYGEEIFQKSDWNFNEWCLHHAKDIKIQQSTHEKDWHGEINPYLGMWFWEEVGFGDRHHFLSLEEADAWLKVYLKQLQDKVGWPLCDNCNNFPERDFGYLRCKPCDQIYIATYPGCLGGEFTDKQGIWIKSDFSNVDEKARLLNVSSDR